MLVLDLCSGLGGFHQVFEESGARVISVDINPHYNPSIVADVINWQYEGNDRVDLILASPDCTQFCKDSLPASWPCNRLNPPDIDMRLAMNIKRIIKEVNPRYWIVENVRGAKGYFSLLFGEVRKISGSRYFWGDFPIFDCAPGYGKWKLSPSDDRSAIRSKIPYQVSKALCLAMGYA
jgi:hypothetical protein